MNNDVFLGSYNGFEPLFPKGKEWFSAKEVAGILGVSSQYIRNNVFSGGIFAHTKNQYRSPDKKSYVRIHKSAVLIYLLETANYNSKDFLAKMEEILAYKSDYDKILLLKLLKRLTNEKAK